MNSKAQIYLQSVSEILRSLSSSPQLADEFVERLSTASRLLDRLAIDESIAKEASENYVAALVELLPKIERALEDFDGANSNDIQKTLAHLKEEALASEKTLESDFENTLTQIAELQQGLCQLESGEAKQLTQALTKLDTDYAQSVFSEGLRLAEDATAENSSGAMNIRNYDENALLKFITDELPGNSGAAIKSSGFISGGHSKFTLGIELSGVNNIPPGIILRGDANDHFSGANVSYEYHLQKILYNQGVRVAKPLALEENGDVFGAPFMLSEQANGKIIGHMFMLPEPDEQVLVDAAKKLASIHKVPTTEFGDWVENAQGVPSDKVHAWLELGHKDLSQTAVHSAAFEAAFSWLRSNATLNDQTNKTLVHGDFGLNNLLIEDHNVQAILDWEFAHIGNPAYDLGYFYFMAKALGSWDLFLETYEKNGVPLPSEEQINYNILFAATRLGVQCAQAHTAFDMGLANVGAARVISNQYVNESILRISESLDRVL